MFHGRRILVVGALALALPALGAASAPGQAQAQRLIDVQGQRAVFTLPSLPRVGLGFLAGGGLTDAAGEPVGEARSTCTVVEVTTAVPPGAVAHCATVFRFAQGDIHMASLREYGAGPFADTAFAVVGGTGEFSGASGAAEVTVISTDPVTYRFAITLDD
ncbi:hypothetical protein [Actinokineospora sp. NPDC004072]